MPSAKKPKYSYANYSLYKYAKFFTFEEEQKLFRDLYSEDKIKSEEAKWLLFCSQIKTMLKIVHSFYEKDYPIDIQDMYSIGELAIINAIRLFDYTKGYRLVSFIKRAVSNNIRDNFRKEKKHFKNEELILTYDLEEDTNVNDPTYEIYYDEIVDDKTLIEKVFNEISKLSQKDKKILYYNTMTDYSQEEIAKILNMNINTFRRRVYDIRKQIKTNIKKGGN